MKQIIICDSSADVVADRLMQQHCSLTGVLAVCVYMSDIKQFALVNSIYIDYFSASPPARYSSHMSIGRTDEFLILLLVRYVFYMRPKALLLDAQCSALCICLNSF